MIVYHVENVLNGKQYIGMTSMSFENRWKYHVRDAQQDNPKMPLHWAIKKYGPEAFKHRILEECDSKESMIEAERRWIKELGTYENGYNATLGGEGLLGYRHTEDAKRRMSEARKGEKNHNYGKNWGKLNWSDEERIRMSEARKGEGNPFYGKHHSDEAREKISKAQYKSVVQMGTEGNVIATYPSMKEAEMKTSITRQSISMLCRGVRSMAKGYKWSYLNPDRDEKRGVSKVRNSLSIGDY